MILVVAALLTIGVVVFTLLVRSEDLPGPAAVSPARHLEEKKARIRDALGDLEFEYQVGKLSERDYEKTKLDLQKDLARVMSEIGGALETAPVTPASSLLCPHCGAEFGRPMRFCGECGKPMKGETP